MAINCHPSTSLHFHWCLMPFYAYLCTCRRERETKASLKAAQAGQRALEEQQAGLASGLHTLQRMLAKKSASSRSGSRDGGGEAVGCALAALSALLGSLQSGEVAGSQEVMSPQLSVGGGSPGDAAGSAEEAAAAGEQSDPLDIAMLLPEGPDEGISSGVDSRATVLAPGNKQAPLAAPKGGRSSTSSSSEGASPMRLATGSRNSSYASQEAPAGGIAADQRQQQGVAVVARRAASSSTSSQSRIPAAAPPSKPGTETLTPKTCTVGTSGISPVRGRLRELVLGLPGSCGRQGSRATLSGGQEAGALLAGPDSSAPASRARKGWSPARKAQREMTCMAYN
jgi:hypothetical protein